MKNKYKKEVLVLFGKKVKELRLNRDLSLRALEKECDIDNSYISKIEHGKANIRFHTIIELAGAFRVHPKELFSFNHEWEDEAFMWLYLSLAEGLEIHPKELFDFEFEKDNFK